MAIADMSDRTIEDLVSLAGRTAVVTGAGRGIGYAIARRLVEAGARVIVADIERERASEAVNRLETDRALPAGVDVTDRRSIAALADLAVARTGGIDVWVNNAGIYPDDALFDIDDDQWDRVLDVNLRGTYLGAREAATRMIARRMGGVIINISTAPALRSRGRSALRRLEAGGGGPHQEDGGGTRSARDPGPGAGPHGHPHPGNGGVGRGGRLGPRRPCRADEPGVAARPRRRSRRRCPGCLVLRFRPRSFMTGCEVRVDGGDKHGGQT